MGRGALPPRGPWSSSCCALLCVVLAGACEHHDPVSSAPAAARSAAARSAVARPAAASPAPAAPAQPRDVPPGAATQHPRRARALPGPLRRLVWDFPDSPMGELRVLVAVPPRGQGTGKFPVLIALHGMGEAAKGSVRGARGWLDDYRLEHAHQRLLEPPLAQDDLLGLVTGSRLAQMNARLKEQAYQGLIVVMPYTPRELAGEQPFESVLPYGRFLVERVMPRVLAETPALASAAHHGIDGVSLGGRVALLVGLQKPTAFGVVSTLQPAFDADDAPRLVRLARQARQRNPSLVLRLVTSDNDYYRRPVSVISAAFREAGVTHDFVELTGPHDYAFNRGPGAFEMLLYHDTQLAR